MLFCRARSALLPWNSGTVLNDWKSILSRFLATRWKDMSLGGIDNGLCSCSVMDISREVSRDSPLLLLVLGYESLWRWYGKEERRS